MRSPARISSFLAGMMFLVSSQAQSQLFQEKIRSAVSAAPPSISNDATIMDYPTRPGGTPTVLRPGKNKWTCFPDDIRTPGNDPMCLDQMWMLWLQAYLSHTIPQDTASGLAFMLQGGEYASNTDPFATAPPSGQEWKKAPPHLMLIAPERLDTMVFAVDQEHGAPWIMWRGTPYEHLMVPAR